MEETYVESLNNLLANYRIDNPDSVDDIWKYFKENVLSATENVCGWLKKGNWRQQAWVWDNSINDVITEKRRLWKVWENVGSKEDYAKAMKVAKCAVFTAKRKSLDDKFSNKDYVALFRIAKQIRKQNQDVVGEKCVKDDDNNLKNAWKQHYQCLLNVEFPWDETSLSQIEPSIGSAPFITANMVLSSIQKMKLGKSQGPSIVIAEMLKASPDQCSQLIADLINVIIKEGKVPDEWSNGYIVSLCKGKGSALDRRNYCGLKLTDQVLKVVERLIEKIIRECIVIDDMLYIDMVQLMLSSLSDNFKKNFWTKIKTFILLSLILKRLSIEYHVKYYGDLCVL